MERDYSLKGLKCQSCATLLEKELSRCEGVKKVQVNLVLEKLQISFDETQIDEIKIKETIEKLGFQIIKKNLNKTANLKIENLHCQSCVKTVEKIVQKFKGIDDINIDLMSKRLRFKYDENLISIKDVKKILTKSGYQLLDESSQQKENKSENKKGYIVQLFCALLVFYISMGTMLNFPVPHIINPEINPFNFATVQFLLSIPVIYLGREFYINGVKKLTINSPNMDSLIALGTGASFLYSIYGVFKIYLGDTHYVHNLYFESGVVIIALVSLGKYLETITKGKTSEAIKKIIGLKVRKANLCLGDEIKEVDSESVQVGDILLVKTGEMVPTDGVVVEGVAVLDESMLTGESREVKKESGKKIYGATLNKGKNFKMRVTEIGENTILSQIIRLVENAQSSKAPIAKLADTISGYFVKGVIAIAITSSMVWYILLKFNIVDYDVEIAPFILKVFISIAVIACPCSLGLATPTAIIVGIGRGAQLGMLIKSGEGLEELCKADTIIFDKTGTITEGKLKFEKINSFSYDNDELLQYVGSLEQNSEHLIGKIIVEEMNRRGISPKKVENYEMLVGLGIEGVIEDKKIVVGNKRLMRKNGINIDESLDLDGIEVYIAIDNIYVGNILISDKIKDESIETIKELKKIGLDIVMLSGDSRKNCERIAKEVGIKTVFSEVSPEDKYLVVKEFQDKGRKVIMVGDGINDSPALAQSDIGIAIGEGTDIALESSDIILMNKGIKDIIQLVRLSKKTLKIIKENLFWAFIYNSLGIPIACGVLYPFTRELLNPMIAGGAMALSSISVVLNSLRLKNFK